MFQAARPAVRWSSVASARATWYGGKYVVETVQALEALGYRETDLHLVAERLRSDAAHRKAEVGNQKPEIRNRRSGISNL